MGAVLNLQRYATFFGLSILYFVTTKAHLDYPEESLRSAFFKILPVLSLVYIVLNFEEDGDDDKKIYRRNIALGLFISLGGDISLVWRKKFFIPGLLFFAIAHICYIIAMDFKPAGSKRARQVCIGGALVIYAFLWPGIEENLLKFLAGVYAILIFTMGWRALIRLELSGSLQAKAGVIGAFLFVISDLMIAVDKWRFPVPHGNFLIMVTYFAAQLGLAISAE